MVKGLMLLLAMIFTIVFVSNMVETLRVFSFNTPSAALFLSEGLGVSPLKTLLRNSVPKNPVSVPAAQECSLEGVVGFSRLRVLFARRARVVGGFGIFSLYAHEQLEKSL